MAPTRLKVTADVAQEDSRDCRMPILGENLAASVGSRTTPVFWCSIRAALTSSDSTRAYWVQGALGAQQEAQRTAAANEGPAKKRNKK